MTELSPFQWLILGSAGFITVTVIAAVILHRATRRYREIDEYTDAHYRRQNGAGGGSFR